MIPLVSQSGQNLVDVLFGWGDRGSIHPPRNYCNSVFFGLSLFGDAHEGKNVQVHNILDVQRLKEPIIGIAFGPRPLVNAVIHHTEMF